MNDKYSNKRKYWETPVLSKLQIISTLQNLGGTDDSDGLDGGNS